MKKFKDKLSKIFEINQNFKSDINSTTSNTTKIEIDDNFDFKNETYENRIKVVKKYFTHCDDLRLDEFSFDSYEGYDSCIIYISSIVEDTDITEKIIKPLLNTTLNKTENDIDNISELLSSAGTLLSQYKKINTLNDALNSILAGETILLSKTSKDCFSISTIKYFNYELTESQTEISIKGPKTALTNIINTNEGLIRKYIQSPKLKIRTLNVGKYSKTKVSILYIDDLAPLEIVDDILKRTSKIDLDGILDVSYVQEMIEPNVFTIFPQTLITERVDRVVGNLLEGRIALLVDGTSSAAIMPVTLDAFFQTPEDYYIRPIFVSFLRMFRYMAFFIATSATPLYVAIAVYHYEVIPFKLLLPFGESQAPLPFPPFFEAFMLEIFAEILRESTSRISGSMGPMIGILGAVLVGEAAVKANLVSSVLVIIVAIGIVSSFSIPNYELIMSSRIIKFITLFAGGIFLAFGVTTVWIILAIHLCSLCSFGVPYLTGIAPFKIENIKDLLIRVPHKYMKKRERKKI